MSKYSSSSLGGLGVGTSKYSSSTAAVMDKYISRGASGLGGTASSRGFRDITNLTKSGLLSKMAAAKGAGTKSYLRPSANPSLVSAEDKAAMEKKLAEIKKRVQEKALKEATVKDKQARKDWAEKELAQAKKDKEQGVVRPTFSSKKRAHIAKQKQEAARAGDGRGTPTARSASAARSFRTPRNESVAPRPAAPRPAPPEAWWRVPLCIPFQFRPQSPPRIPARTCANSPPKSQAQTKEKIRAAPANEAARQKRLEWIAAAKARMQEQKRLQWQQLSNSAKKREADAKAEAKRAERQEALKARRIQIIMSAGRRSSRQGIPLSKAIEQRTQEEIASLERAIQGQHAQNPNAAKEAAEGAKRTLGPLLEQVYSRPSAETTGHAPFEP